jgi:hypothetical protein
MRVSSPYVLRPRNDAGNRAGHPTTSMSNLRWFAGLTRRDRALLTEALIALPVCVVGLKLVGYRRLRLLLARLAHTAPAPMSRSADKPSELVARTAWAVRTAAKHGPVRGRCLPQSLALWLLLRRRQVGSEIRFGARRHDGELQAHAWVEVDGRAVMARGEEGTAFTPFSRAPTAGEARLR